MTTFQQFDDAHAELDTAYFQYYGISLGQPRTKGMLSFTDWVSEVAYEHHALRDAAAVYLAGQSDDTAFAPLTETNPPDAMVPVDLDGEFQAAFWLLCLIGMVAAGVIYLTR